MLTSFNVVRTAPAALMSVALWLSAWVPLPLHLTVDYGFLYHGPAKAGRGLDAFPALVAALNVPFPKLADLAPIGVAIGGGLLVRADALVPVPATIVLLPAMFTIHWQCDYSTMRLPAITPVDAQFGPPGHETNLLYLAGLAALVMSGPGLFSVDRFLARRVGMASDVLASAAAGHPSGRSASNA